MSINRAAGTAVVCGNLVLLAKRCEFWGPQKAPVAFGGYWSVFGGTVEENENPMTCAVRELEEETQIKINVTDLKFIKTIRGETLREFTFYITEVNDLVTPVLNEEHTEFGWFKIDALNTFPEKIDPKIVECIDMYAKKFNI